MIQIRQFIENIFGKPTRTYLTDDRHTEILDKPRQVSCDCSHDQRGTGANGRNDELVESV